MATGHSLKTPDGRRIRVDRDALAELQKKGLLKRHRTAIHPAIYEVLKNGQLISDRLRRHLGPDLSGPSVVVCHCEQCTKDQFGEAEVQAKPTVFQMS